MKTTIEVDLIDVKKVTMINGSVNIELPNDVHLLIVPHAIKYISSCIDTILKKQIEGELNEDNNN